jgi:hypothetical protein
MASGDEHRIRMKCVGHLFKVDFEDDASLVFLPCVVWLSFVRAQRESFHFDRKQLAGDLRLCWWLGDDPFRPILQIFKANLLMFSWVNVQRFQIRALTFKVLSQLSRSRKLNTSCHDSHPSFKASIFRSAAWFKPP